MAKVSKELQSAMMEVYDARTLNREYLRIIENQVELVIASMRNGNNAFIKDGLEILRSYINSEYQHMCDLVDQSKKKLEEVSVFVQEGI